MTDCILCYWETLINVELKEGDKVRELKGPNTPFRIEVYRLTDERREDALATIDARIVDWQECFGDIGGSGKTEIQKYYQGMDDSVGDLFSVVSEVDFAEQYGKYGFATPSEKFIYIDRVYTEPGKVTFEKEALSAIPYVAQKLFGNSSTLVFFREYSTFGFKNQIPAGLKAKGVECPGGFCSIRFREECLTKWTGWEKSTLVQPQTDLKV